MRSVKNVFHLAIPCDDLDRAEDFYTRILGCRRARRDDDRITLDFFGDQVVCHLAPESVDSNPRMYPRHFGITFLDRSDFQTLTETAMARGARILQAMSTRFKGEREQHLTVAFLDPSNNVLEFKYYHDPEMIY